MRAVTYARYSTDMQREASIEDQRRNLHRFAEREGMEITEEFSDAGISGTKRDRPGYQAMLAAAKARAFEVLLVDDLSRLSRDDVETKQTIRRLTFAGIRIVGTSDGFDSASKGHKIQASVRGMMNEIYLDDLAEKTHRGQTGQALKGYNCGGRAFGYRHVPIEDPSHPDQYGRPAVVAVRREIDEQQAKVVRFIFEKYAAGHSPRWIASELNRKGIPSPGASWKRTRRRCNGWVSSAIHGDPKKATGILSNPLYIGRHVWNRSDWQRDPDTGQRRRVPRPEADWIVVDDERLRIIPDKLWKRVQARRGERSIGPHQDIRPRAKFLLSGVLKCVCGSNYVMVDGQRYGCASSTNGGRHLCGNSLKVPRRLVEEKLLEGIKTELFTPEAIEHFRRETIRLLAERRRERTPDAAQVEIQLCKVNTEIENLTAAIRTGIHSPALLAALEKAELEKARLEVSQTADNKALDKMAAFLPRAMDRYVALVTSLPTVLQRDVARARAQIKTLLGGSVKLLPTKEGLVAELAGDFAGLLKLASGSELNLRGSGGRI